ncbi:MAG: EamA family transporter [Geminicoccaceae bacterium]|nr:EamA family transporter [Geminicoccaceae bacterium]MCB9942917.1 EamA family transporter [Geminicoccaceae bacterium]
MLQNSPDTLVVFVVLGAAFMHATWNALVKTGGDPFIRMAIVSFAHVAMVLPLLFFANPPDAAAWPWLIGSIVTHVAYYTFLASGYRVGDLSHLYPIARGIAPPLVAVGAIVFQGEWLSTTGTIAFLAICIGIWMLASTGRGTGPVPLLYALATGTMIGGYTICDGMGGRLTSDVLDYIVWLFALEGWPFILAVLWFRRANLAASLRRAFVPAFIGGILSTTAYGLVIWAMTQMPLAHVSALRETSVLIAAMIGTMMLGEPFGRKRIASAVIVAGGVALLHLSG